MSKPAKLEITLHAPSKRALRLFREYLASAAQDFNDSGESPSGVWYEEGKIEEDKDAETES